MTETMYKEILIQQDNYRRVTGREPNFIVLNPKALRDLFYHKAPPASAKDLLFNGMNVLRSLDIEETEFKLGYDCKP